MSTGILRIFYASTAWKKCRDAFFTSKFGLCEDCGSLGEIVHHIKPITASDVRTNPDKCYGWDNLKLVCRECHELHHSKRSDGLSFDANGDYSGSDVKTIKIKKIMYRTLPISNLNFLRTEN